MGSDIREGRMKRDPAANYPHVMGRTESDAWIGDAIIVDRNGPGKSKSLTISFNGESYSSLGGRAINACHIDDKERLLGSEP